MDIRTQNRTKLAWQSQKLMAVSTKIIYKKNKYVHMHNICDPICETQHNGAFFEIHIFTPLCSMYQKLCSVVK